jgi:hypothetical protein
LKKKSLKRRVGWIIASPFILAIVGMVFLFFVWIASVDMSRELISDPRSVLKTLRSSHKGRAVEREA